MTDSLARARSLQRAFEAEASLPSGLFNAAIECIGQLNWQGESSIALDLVRVAEQKALGEGLETRLRLAYSRADTLRASQRYSEALEAARTLQHEVGNSSRALALELRLLESVCLVQLNRYAEAIGQLAGLRASLLQLPDSPLLARCSFNLSSAHLYAGRHKEARELALESLVSARRCGATEVEGLALGNLSRLDKALCRWSSAYELARDALTIFEKSSGHSHAISAKRSMAIIAWKWGRLEDAATLASWCINEASQTGKPVLRAYSQLLHGLVSLHAGQISSGQASFDTVLEFAKSTGTSRLEMLSTEFLGDCLFEQGDATSAKSKYDLAFTRALALAPKGDIVAELRRRIAECNYLLGHHELAYDEARQGLEHCRELGDRYEEAATYRVLALSAAALGKVDEARRWFEQGFAYYDDIETPYEWGKLWLAYGDWLSGPNAGPHADRRGALEAFHAARDHFERMGAQAKLAEANDRIVSLLKAVAEAEQTLRIPEPEEIKRSPRRPRRSTDLDRRSEWARDTFGLITRNKSILDLLETVRRLAASNSSILILGESGTGKELIAHGVHRLSARSGAFIPVNCGALPRDIIESELFGHVSGAFTGATRDKAGLFEVGDRGTVFLDEVAEMSPELQTRLLRFLESGETRRVGASRSTRVDTRVVAATNRENAALERGDGFRQDLYYRLAHAVITLPPLRRRGDDVELLVDHFIESFQAEYHHPLRLTRQARARLLSYPWPGNIRQMKALIRRLAILSTPDREITLEDLQLDDADVPTSLLEEVEQVERRRVIQALAESRGSRTEAAKLLGMPRTSLLNKMKRFGLM